MRIKEYERKIGYGEDWLKTILEVQFAFLSRVEKVKLYMAMMSLEKILIIHGTDTAIRLYRLQI